MPSRPRGWKRAIEQFHALAQINGLEHNRHDEIEAVETFFAALREAVDLDNTE